VLGVFLLMEMQQHFFQTKHMVNIILLVHVFCSVILSCSMNFCIHFFFLYFLGF
jgi:hypothetical protein